LRNHTFEVRANTSIRRTLKDLNMQPDAFLIILDGALVADDEMIKTNRVIRLIPVISEG